ncbi:MAG: hypothetical protein CMN30_29055 [Sandaracinus sp.]|nr:hypothetical protein [Sandaracinus sp.]|tara:strand:- start:824 stop:2248 length:1425 start_codon:yes stop_codon:yes gene_type:complete
MTKLPIAAVVLLGIGAAGLGAWLTMRGAPVAERLDREPAETSEDESPGPVVVETDEGLRLGAPAPPQSWAVPAWAPGVATDEHEGSVAMAYQYAAPVFRSAREGAPIAGTVRRGTAIPVRGAAFGSGCRRRWYEVEGGFVCSSEGFAVGPAPEERPQHAPDLTQAMPFQYAMVTRRGAPRLYRTPLAEEVARIRDPEREAEPEVVQMRMAGDYFVARAAIETGPGGDWQQTVRGQYVNREDLEDLPMPQLVGEHLEADALPMAFVYAEDRPLYRVEAGGLVEVGTAAKYARFHVTDEVEVDGDAYAVGPDGLAVRRDQVRVAARAPRDERVEGDRWIHVDLDEQVLIAYDEGEPVYATLVASGKEGYDTPRGVFRIDKKFLSVTMSGEDPHDGPFEVEEVPWTMYYWESYALHGAYWHDAFGQVRSHGCTNLAPADARWLFEWTNPALPPGFHGYNARRGTWVQLTRASSEGDA